MPCVHSGDPHPLCSPPLGSTPSRVALNDTHRDRIPIMRNEVFHQWRACLFLFDNIMFVLCHTGGNSIPSLSHILNTAFDTCDQVDTIRRFDIPSGRVMKNLFGSMTAKPLPVFEPLI